MKVKAFTLIELLVVVAIIGILAAVGVVAYNGYTKSAKANSTIQQFKSVEKHITNSLKLCDFQGGGSVALSPTRSINCNIVNNKYYGNRKMYILYYRSVKPTTSLSSYYRTSSQIVFHEFEMMFFHDIYHTSNMLGV